MRHLPLIALVFLIFLPAATPHAHAAPASPAPPSPAPRLALAEGLDDAGMAAFRKAFSAEKCAAVRTGPLIEVTASGLKGPMRLRADLKKEERLAIEGGEPIPPGTLLWLNGHDIGREILKTAPAVRALLAKNKE